MIHIRTASRLHFGLLSLLDGDPPRAFWPNREGREVVLARRFGGVGLMIEEPGIELSVAASSRWSGTGPAGSRAIEVAQQFALSRPPQMVRPCAVTVDKCAPLHSGLGSGTQLSLAVARALSLELGMGPIDGTNLAASVGRGLRSAVGIHGFEHGGFLVEAGRRDGGAIASLVARQAFPDAWRVVLAIPKGESGRHGTQESQFFEQLLHTPASLRTTEALCRLALLGLLPALIERDYTAFAEALFDFNAVAGELFAPVQHGIYSSPGTRELVGWLRNEGVVATGQSSWGPTVFGIVEDDEKATTIAARLREEFRFSPDEVVVTRGCNEGARVTIV